MLALNKNTKRKSIVQCGTSYKNRFSLKTNGVKGQRCFHGNKPIIIESLICVLITVRKFKDDSRSGLATVLI